MYLYNFLSNSKVNVHFVTLSDSGNDSMAQWYSGKLLVLAFSVQLYES